MWKSSSCSAFWKRTEGFPPNNLGIWSFIHTPIYLDKRPLPNWREAGPKHDTTPTMLFWRYGVSWMMLFWLCAKQHSDHIMFSQYSFLLTWFPSCHFIPQPRLVQNAGDESHMQGVTNIRPGFNLYAWLWGQLGLPSWKGVQNHAISIVEYCNLFYFVFLKITLIIIFFIFFPNFLFVGKSH